MSDELISTLLGIVFVAFGVVIHQFSNRRLLTGMTRVQYKIFSPLLPVDEEEYSTFGRFIYRIIAAISILMGSACIIVAIARVISD